MTRWEPPITSFDNSRMKSVYNESDDGATVGYCWNPHIRRFSAFCYQVRPVHVRQTAPVYSLFDHGHTLVPLAYYEEPDSRLLPSRRYTKLGRYACASFLVPPLSFKTLWLLAFFHPGYLLTARPLI